MYPQNVQDNARRNQLMMMLAQAFGAPQGQFGTGLLQGSYAGQQEYQRTLDAFMAQQQQQQAFDLDQQLGQARLAQMTAPQPDPVAERQRMEEMLMQGGMGPYYQPPQPDPVQERLRMEGALREQGLGPYYQEPQQDPVAQRLRMEQALKSQGLGSYYQKPQQAAGPEPDPLLQRAILEAGMYVRQNKLDPSMVEPLTREFYQAMKAGSRRADEPVMTREEALGVSGQARQDLEAGNFGGGIPGLGTPTPPPPPNPLQILGSGKRPKPPTLEGKGSGGDGAIRLQQLLAENPEINRAEVEKAKRDGMSEDAIADLIEAQLAQAGGGM